MDTHQQIQERIEKLKAKYEASGQDLVAFLDGLLFADYLTYWDYIHLDTLLSLQNPRTAIPDEKIFIMYHQITELYFKLSLWEIEQIATLKNDESEVFLIKLDRINRYFDALTHSFGVMEKGMDRAQFLDFRLALIPASGFQSAQYRMIEMGATDMYNLVDKDKRPTPVDKNSSLDQMYEYIYWKNGATIEATGEKTLTLKQFEEKYFETFMATARKYQHSNLWRVFLRMDWSDESRELAVNALRKLDLNVNVFWPLQHYKTAVAYLAKRPHDIAATGGTNWQKYLPPRFQKRIFYPELWTETEKEEWGKSWVEGVLKENS